MNPLDLLAELQAQHQAQVEQPDPEQEFTREQTASIVASIEDTNKKLVSFLLKYSPDVSVKNFPKPQDSKEVVKAIKDLGSTLKPIPDDDSGVINAINSLKSQNEALVKIIQQLELKPEITVSVPEVKVDAPDFKPVIKAIEKAKPEPVVIDNSSIESLLRDNLAATKAVARSINGLSFPVANTPTDPLIKYNPADLDDVPAVQYFGYTDNSGAWYVKRIDTSVAPKTIRYSFGQSDYATNWTNRASLTYSVWGS